MLKLYFGIREVSIRAMCIQDTSEAASINRYGRWEIHVPVSRQLTSRVSTGTRGVRIRLPLLKTAMPSKASPTTLNQRLSGSRQHGHNKNIRRGALIISHQQRWHPPWTSFDDVDEKFRGLVGLLEIIWLRSTAGTSIRDLPISKVRGATYKSLMDSDNP